MSINVVVVSGHLVRDPELREKKDGNETTYRASFVIGVNRKGKNSDSDFPRIICFGNLAKACADYLKKGSMCTVVGRIRTGSYTKDDGTRVYTTDVFANSVQFETSPKSGSGPSDSGAPDNEFPAAEEISGDISSEAVEGVPEGFQIVDDEDIPF